MTYHENRLYCSVACLAGALLVLVALTSGTAWAAPPVSEEAGQQKNMPPARAPVQRISEPTIGMDKR